MLGIMLREIGSHLQRRIHSHIKRKLVSKGGEHLGILSWHELGEVHFENTRSEVHRTAIQTSELKYGGMIRLSAAKCLILSTPG